MISNLLSPTAAQWGGVGCWAAVVLSPLIVLFASKLMQRMGGLRLVLALVLALWGMDIFSSYNSGHTNEFLGDFINCVNVFSTSRIDVQADRACPNRYLWIEYWTMMYVIALGFAVLGRRLCNACWAFAWLLLARCGLVRASVFWGHSAETLSMLQDLQRQRGWLFRAVLPRFFGGMFGPIVAVESDASVSESVRRERFDVLEDLGSIPIYEGVSSTLRSGLSISNGGVLHLSYWRLWADRHFLLGADEEVNAGLCRTIIRSLAQRRLLPRRRKVLYVRLASRDVAEELSTWLSRNGRLLERSAADVRILLEPEMIASDLVRRYPILRSPGVDLVRCPVNASAPSADGSWAKCRLLVVGAGNCGIAVLNASICDAQCLGLDFSATLVDRNPAGHGRYLVDFGECVESYRVGMLEMDALSADFVAWFGRQMTNSGDDAYDRVVVCLGDARTNRHVASRLARVLSVHGIDSRERVFACGEKGAELCEAPSDAYRIFGTARAVFSVDHVIRERDFGLAKVINYAYCNSQPRRTAAGNVLWRYDAGGSWDAIERCWSRADYYSRASSIAAASGMRNWFAICGWRGGDLLREGEGLEVAARRLVAHMDYFAHSEHLRWNAFMRTSGVRSADWKKGNPLPFVEGRGYVAKFTDVDRVVRRHAAIMPFDGLKELDDAIDELNRAAIREGRLSGELNLSVLCANDVKIIEAVVARLAPSVMAEVGEGC